MARPSVISPRDWPLMRQLRGEDRIGRGAAVKSRRSTSLRPRTADADRVVKSVCPYCAVGCAQNVYVKDDKVVQIEGDPDAPHSRGRLCPKGSASLQLTTGSAREQHVLYRPPHGTEWERLELDTAIEMVLDRVIATRREGWEWERDGRRTRRCMSIAALGGATLDNEENYLIKKLLTALGIVQIENQARAGELVAEHLLERRLGIVAETLQDGTAGRRLKAAKALSAIGALGAATVARRSRLGAALSGAGLLAGSALTRFGLFAAGMASARDPRYTVAPQRERLRRQEAGARRESGTRS
jgi:formate dehydrogenase major subunit